MALDRLAPARRDACRTRKTGEQTWRDLLFLHWEVPDEILERYVPSSLSVDRFEGRAYLGLVPFTMHRVRVGPLHVPDFLETNLRTYVHADGVPGVWFLSLDAVSALAVWGARTFYRLPYHRATMACSRAGMTWTYRAHRRGPSGAALDVAWSVQGDPEHHARPGTLEHFLTERYALYGPTRGGGTYRVRVHHAPWPLQPARVEKLATTIPAVLGIDVGEPIDLVLASARGVAVETFAKEAVGGATPRKEPLAVSVVPEDAS
ncbi:MAG: DUF2071 domain-containing protein [Polyangiaceae bacterium]|nr:DUF2071 domain-containing protein [Polyangiaceae bacterium]